MKARKLDNPQAQSHIISSFTWIFYRIEFPLANTSDTESIVVRCRKKQRNCT
jgi:hypothetical protein